MRHREAPLLVAVVIKQHATKQPGGVSRGQGDRRQARGHGGRGSPVPGAARTLLLQQVLSQDAHQVLVQTHMVPVVELFRRDRQRVLAASRLSHTKVSLSSCLYPLKKKVAEKATEKVRSHSSMEVSSLIPNTGTV